MLFPPCILSHICARYRQDAVVVGSVAVAVARKELEELVEFFKSKQEYLHAAQITWAVSNVQGGAWADGQAVNKQALALLKQSGASSVEAQQLELDVLLATTPMMVDMDEKQPLVARTAAPRAARDRHLRAERERQRRGECQPAAGLVAR